MPHVELPQAEFKVVMLGDTHVGKTSLVLRFVEGYFRPQARTPTVGAFFITKRLQVEGILCKVQIWDTAGQPQFRPLAKMYYSSAAAAVLCFDVNSRASLDVVKFWVDELHRNVAAGSIVLCLCACKVDDRGPRVVSSQEAKQLAQATGALYVETSAKNNDSVQDLFEQLAERVLQFQKKPGVSIPVTPGATIDSNGQVVVKSPPRQQNQVVNRYGLVLDSADYNSSRGAGSGRRYDDEEEKKDQSPPRAPQSLQNQQHQVELDLNQNPHQKQHKPRRDKRTKSKPLPEDDEVLPNPSMCGVFPSSTNDVASSDCLIS